MRKKRFLFILLAVLLLCPGCSAPVRPVSRTAAFFDTVITIRIYDKDAEDVLNSCLRKCTEYENRFSRTIEDSEIFRLNHAGGEPVELSPDTIALLRLGLKYSELSGGSFDITIAPLSDLWDFKHNPGKCPDEAEILEARSHVNYRSLIIEDNTARLTDPSAAVDLGGIAKGYIADQLKAYMKSEGIRHAIIDLGGNVLALGDKPDGTAFNIGIQKPFDETGTAITSVRLKDRSLVSSGIYQRYFKENGVLYHHILNPATGYPYENNLLGVTILCSSSAEADALSTTCFALGLEDGTAFINSLPDTEALFITDDYKLHPTSGFPQ